MPVFSIHGNHDDPQGAGAVSSFPLTRSPVTLRIHLAEPQPEGWRTWSSRPALCQRPDQLHG